MNYELLSCSLTIFQLFCLEVGIGVGIAIACRLIVLLSLQQVNHLCLSYAVVVVVKTQIFVRLSDSLVGDGEFLVTYLDSLPGVIHADDESLAVVLQLVLRIFHSEVLFLVGV